MPIMIVPPALTRRTDNVDNDASVIAMRMQAIKIDSSSFRIESAMSTDEEDDA